VSRGAPAGRDAAAAPGAEPCLVSIQESEFIGFV
jgi:hypothetical protein